MMHVWSVYLDKKEGDAIVTTCRKTIHPLRLHSKKDQSVKGYKSWTVWKTGWEQHPVCVTCGVSQTQNFTKWSSYLWLSMECVMLRRGFTTWRPGQPAMIRVMSSVEMSELNVNSQRVIIKTFKIKSCSVVLELFARVPHLQSCNKTPPTVMQRKSNDTNWHNLLRNNVTFAAVCSTSYRNCAFNVLSRCWGQNRSTALIVKLYLFVEKKNQFSLRYTKKEQHCIRYC